MSSSEPQKRAQLYGIGIGQGLLIISHEWSGGWIGGCCAVQAIASGMWVCCGGGACQSAQQAEYMPLALACTTHHPSMHPQYKTEGSLFYILKCSEWHNVTLRLCSFISHTQIYSPAPRNTTFILHWNLFCLTMISSAESWNMYPYTPLFENEQKWRQNKPMETTDCDLSCCVIPNYFLLP